MLRVALTVLIAVSMAIGLPVAAQTESGPDDDPILSLPEDEALRALSLLDQGDAARSEQRYHEAIEAYLALIAIVEHEGVWLDIAECRIALGEYEAAAWILERLSSSDDPGRAAQAAGAIDELYDAHPARLLVTSTVPDTRCGVGSQPEQPIGADGTTFVLRAGTHEVRCRAPGHRSYIATTWLSPGARIEEQVILDVDPVASPPVPVTVVPVQDRPAERRAASVAVPTSLGVLSLGAFGTAAAFGVTANQRADEYNTYDVTSPDASLDAWDMLARQSQDAARRSNIMVGVGSGLAVATVASAIAFRAHGRARQERVTVTPWFGREGIGTSAGLRW